MTSAASPLKEAQRRPPRPSRRRGELFIAYLTHFPRKCGRGMWNMSGCENAGGSLLSSTFSLAVNSAAAPPMPGTASSAQTPRCQVTSLPPPTLSRVRRRCRLSAWRSNQGPAWPSRGLPGGPRRAGRAVRRDEPRPPRPPPQPAARPPRPASPRRAGGEGGAHAG